MYYAHIRKNNDGTNETQTVQQHCLECAQYASERVIAILKSTAYLSGLIHDLGKLKVEFENYIEKASNGGKVAVGSVNHTFAGVKYILDSFHNSDDYEKITSEIIAFAAGAHHGQFDCVDLKGNNGFLHRINDDTISFEECKNNFFEFCKTDEEIKELFYKSVDEIKGCLSLIRKELTDKSDEFFFYVSLIARYILSAVIEGDRRSTIEFMELVKYPKHDNIRNLWEKNLEYFNDKINDLPLKNDIDKARRKISDICYSKADGKSGVYKLSVPTGGGKTLTSLRYALKTAAINKKRIIYVIPLLSVIDQNSKVIKDYIKNSEIITEHHSNIVNDENDENDILIQSWDSPIIITTLVQFLNTLFDGRTSCIRRFNSLTDSVIIIDEVQTVPKNMITIFNLAMNFLANICGATIVLCSATQPCFDKTDHKLKFSENYDLVPFENELWDIFRRTEIIDKRINGGYSYDEICDFVVECKNKYNTVLIICNKKEQSRLLYNSLSASGEKHLFHLSNSMCMKHRVNTLNKINGMLYDAKYGRVNGVICVSTQLVEAGVDFSFGCVIRVAAGMDNIVQSAGRCNRNGESDEKCPVYIVNIHGESLKNLHDIKMSQNSTMFLLDDFKGLPDKYDNDLASEKAINEYYERLYKDMKTNEQDYLLEKSETTMFSVLSQNKNAVSLNSTNTDFRLNQAFKTAGDSFKVFETNTFDIVVPYNESKELIAQLCSQRAKDDLNYRYHILNDLNLSWYCVSVYSYEINKLIDKKAINKIYDDSVIILKEGYYSEETGIILDEQENRIEYLEV